MITSQAELDRVRDACFKMVRRKSLVSAGAAVVPIPGLDLTADVGLLTSMLGEINRRFGLDEGQVSKMDPQRADRVLVLASSLGNSVIGRAVTKRIVIALLRRFGVRLAAGQAAKFVPLLGQAVSAGISFGAMRYVGNAHVRDCYETARRALLADPPVAGR